MALDGVIFDLDGTLVDSNQLHVEAWRQVFGSHGYHVAPDRIFIEIGKGGDHLVPDLMGKEIDQRDGEVMRKEQPKVFAKLAQAQGLKPFDGSRELLSMLRERGLKTVLATSSSKAHLDVLERASGFPVRKLVDEVVTADDADHSKPAPDIVTVAYKKLGMSPAQCVMFGDTPHDATSAKHAGVALLGLTCGGHDVKTLIRSGARAVWTNPADIIAYLDEALRIASPGVARLTQNALEHLMHQALHAAEEGMNAGEVPIGCVLARGDASVIASGFNELNRTGNPAAHAETITITKAAQIGAFANDPRDLILVSTLEPCVMCTGTAMECAVDTIVYGLKAPADSGTARVMPPESPESAMPRIVGDVLAKKSRALFKEWLKKPGNNPKQVRFVSQLLALTKGN
jgi:HAD superfamily hydrolase (TIGR01509 family)